VAAESERRPVTGLLIDAEANQLAISALEYLDAVQKYEASQKQQ
jgi:hypothetical protein